MQLASSFNALRRLTLSVLILLVSIPCFSTTPTGQEQLIWFAPSDPTVRPGNRSGSIDYSDLFNAMSPWSQAASHVRVFKVYASIYITSLPNALTEAQVRQAFSDLERRGIALAVEWGPLTRANDASQCGLGVEGFNGDNAFAFANRLKQLGGNLKYIAMDEPYYYASSVCKWTPQQIAENAARNIAEIKKVFPDVIVGDIEPVPGKTADWLAQYAAWTEAWRVATGTPLAFFHADVIWGTNYQPAMNGLRKVLVQHQIPLGVIYNGAESDGSDSNWVNDAQRNYETLEVSGGLVPDHVIFQSWNNYPKHVLPESDPTTFTHLINTYFRARTNLSTNFTLGQVYGVLKDSNGKPIAGSQITVTAEPESGQGVVSSYTLKGTVPAAIGKALMQICVNLCGSNSTNEMGVYSFDYTDTTAKSAFDFSGGLSSWGLEGNRTASVELTVDEYGKALQIAATENQHVFINSQTFAVTPGSAYELNVRARISPASIGSGVFALIFLADKESSREVIPFQPGKISVGTTQTLPDGSYRVPFVSPSPVYYKIQSVLNGTDLLWPAMATVEGAPLNFTAGWNLAGNSVSASLNVAGAFGDTSSVNSVWKWNPNGSGKWAFYSPSLVGQALNDYADGHGFEKLSTINAGEGFWVNAKTSFSMQLPAADGVSLASLPALSTGWNLIAIGDTITPAGFSTTTGTSPSTIGSVPQNLTSLWAWDNANSKWYFYAPSLETQGATALSAYISSQGYLDFTSANRTLGPGVGFWVNKP